MYLYGNENVISKTGIMPTLLVLSMLWNVKLKPTVKLMLRPTLNLGTMEYTAIPINIKDSTMDMLMVKDTICLPTLDILPLPIPDILLLLTPDILPLLTPDILPLFSHMPFKDQIPGPIFSRLKLLCNVCWSSLLKIMKFLNICTFHLANICIIKIRIFSIKTSVLFLLTNYIAPNWFQSAQGTKKANIYTFYNARSLLMYSKYITYLLHSLTRELDIKELCFVFFPNRKKNLSLVWRR